MKRKILGIALASVAAAALVSAGVVAIGQTGAGQGLRYETTDVDVSYALFEDDGSLDEAFERLAVVSIFLHGPRAVSLSLV